VHLTPADMTALESLAAGVAGKRAAGWYLAGAYEAQLADTPIGSGGDKATDSRP